MDAKQNCFDLQIQFYKIFKDQDPESEELDVVFDIGGKKLYANKSRLTVVSPTFKSMLSERWNPKKDEPIPVSDYSFEDFKEFLTFIYSGECSLNVDNIFAMIDMAEYYGAQIFKNVCVQFLLNTELTMDNVFLIMEISNKYSLFGIMQEFLCSNFNNIVRCKKFLDVNKTLIEDILVSVGNFVVPENLFQAIYQWAEHQAMKKQNESIQDNFNLNDAIKNEITPFLQYIRFRDMSLRFLTKYAVQRSFIFPGNDLGDIMEKSLPTLKVRIINSNGHSISGALPFDSEAVEIIRRLKNVSSGIYHFMSWNVKFKMPLTSSPLKKRDEVKWYLIYFSEGTIGAVSQKNLQSCHYLLAEMIPVSFEFVITQNCKIEIW